MGICTKLIKRELRVKYKMKNFDFFKLWIGLPERESKNGLFRIFACSTAIYLLSIYVKKITKINQCKSHLTLTDAVQIISTLECNNGNLIKSFQLQRNLARKAEKRIEKLQEQIAKADRAADQTSISLLENEQEMADKDQRISQLRENVAEASAALKQQQQQAVAATRSKAIDVEKYKKIQAKCDKLIAESEQRSKKLKVALINRKELISGEKILKKQNEKMKLDIEEKTQIIAHMESKIVKLEANSLSRSSIKDLEPECNICCEPYGEDRKLLALDPCGHTICNQCQRQLSNHQCHQCRARYVKTIPIYM